jgi:hypothetical protein
MSIKVLIVAARKDIKNAQGVACQGVVSMSIGNALKLFALALIVLGVAFGLRRTFFWDVAPVSWDQEPQSLWALGAAFLLRTLENVAVVVAGLSLIVAGASRLIRWRDTWQKHTDNRAPRAG